ncbi:potassium/proton antiporter, partial [Clostridium perfringens]|nr:potassium/proton antiporter [Clostridium perfringens]
DIPEDILIVMIKRNDEDIVPKGSKIVKSGDVLVLSANSFDNLVY